ncbi:MAG: hypothetical protein M3Q45_00165, partial [Chloroflexota bacterium]|nr:hypothetical protein [Chloroflexota bacterium]
RTPAFVGRSAILAPQELTPRLNGIMVEMGNQRSEGVLTAELDFVALKNLWETSETPVRKQVALGGAGDLLAKLYQRLQALPRLTVSASGAETTTLEAQDALHRLLTNAPIDLDELPVISSLTSRWPLAGSDESLELQLEQVTNLSELPAHRLPARSTPASYKTQLSPTEEVIVEDETDEMDALPGASGERT